MQRFQPTAAPSVAASDAAASTAAIQSGPLPDLSSPALSPRGERARSVSGGGGASRPAAGGRDKYDFSHLSLDAIELELTNLKCAAGRGSGRLLQAG